MVDLSKYVINAQPLKIIAVENFIDLNNEDYLLISLDIGLIVCYIFKNSLMSNQVIEKKMNYIDNIKKLNDRKTFIASFQTQSESHIGIYNFESFSLIRSIYMGTQHNFSICTLQYSNIFAISSSLNFVENWVSIFSIDGGIIKKINAGHTNVIKDMIYLEDGETLVSADSDGVILFF